MIIFILVAIFMKNLHTKISNSLLIVVLLSAISSCTTIPGSWKDEKISSGQRDDFHRLNTEALEGLKADDPKALKMVFSKELNEHNDERQIRLISNRLNDNDYELKDEFYAVHKYKDTDTVHSTGGDINRYDLLYPYTTLEMYFAFFVPKKSDNQYMISLAYSKFDYGWKLVKMEVAPYTINGKTAPELYAIAQAQYKNKEMQAALNNMSLAVTCFKPNSYIRYPDAVDGANFYKRVNEDVKYKYRYPLVLKQLSTGPMILRVYSKKSDDGTFPLIYYMTHFDLKDTNAVKKENLQVRNVVQKIMPGLTDNNKYIFYTAFNKQPTGYSIVKHFDITVKN